MCANVYTLVFMIYSQDVISSMIYFQNTTSERLQVDSLFILIYSNYLGLFCLLNNEKNINKFQGDKQKDYCCFKGKPAKCLMGAVFTEKKT